MLQDPTDAVLLMTFYSYEQEYMDSTAKSWLKE